MITTRSARRRGLANRPAGRPPGAAPAHSGALGARLHAVGAKVRAAAKATATVAAGGGVGAGGGAVGRFGARVGAAVRSPGGRVAGDAVLAVACAAVAVAVHLGGSEAVPANHAPTALSVAITAAGGAVLVLRRRSPLPVLIATTGAALALVVIDQAVGMATVAPFIAFYTAVASGGRRQAREAVAVIAAVIVLTAALRPVDLSAEGALVNLIALAFAWTLGNGTRERRERHTAELDLANQRAEQVAVTERLRITRELHDVLGHALSVMVVQAEVADRLLATRPDQAAAAIRSVGATGRDSLTEMRRLLTLVRDGASPADRQPAPTLAELPALVERVRAAGLAVEVDDVAEGTSSPVPPGVELAAYRVVQEALTNCLRHSGATRARVRLHHRPGARLLVDVTDDGPGGAEPVPGHGLTGMRERVAVYGGTFAAGRAPEGGFTVHAEFPLTAAVP